MRTADLFRLALQALWQQKTRSALTMMGVILGACMLTMSLSIGTGVQDAVKREFRKNNRLRRIEIYAGSGDHDDEEAGIPPAAIAVTGEMSPERRQRLRKMLIQHWHSQNMHRAPVPLTRVKIAELKQLEHVESVVPAWFESGQLTLHGKSMFAQMRATQADNRGLQQQLVAGALPPTSDSHAIVVHEFVLYQLGVRNETDVQNMLGQPVQLEIYNDWRSPRQLLSFLDTQPETLSTDEIQLLEKIKQTLPAALEQLPLSQDEKKTLREMMQRRDPFVARPTKVTATEQFTIAGVFRSLDPEEIKKLQFYDFYYQYTDVVVPYVTAETFGERLPRRNEGGYDSLTLHVDQEENVRAVVDQLPATGVRHFSAVEFVEHVLREVRLIRYATTFIAGVALLVAALGITNTMVTSVLERTQEIGIMKAVGAKDRHVQLMFLIEGAVLGLIGGSVGLLAAWLISLPGDSYARKLMEQQSGNEVTQALFVFPAWLLISVPLFAVLMTTVAAFYPARRAARIDPIQALRHE